VCVVRARTGGGCTPNAFAGRDFQVQTCGHVSDGRFEVSGLAPDSAAAAVLLLRDGRRIPVQISRSFLTITRRATARGDLPVAVELREPSGTRRQRIPPVRLADLACAGRR